MSNGIPRPVIVGLAQRADDAAPIALAQALARVAGAPLVFATAAGCATAAALRDLASRRSAAAVVVGSTRHGTLGRVLHGDVAAELLATTPCPVAVSPRGYRAPAHGLKRIAVLFSDTPDGRRALAGATGIARAVGGSIRSFTVAGPRADGGSVAEEACAAVRALLPPDVPGGAAALEGDAACALARATAHEDLLICGHAEDGATRRRLMHAVHCPVLVLPRAGGGILPLLPDLADPLEMTA